MSCTVTVWAALAELPEESVAVQIIAVVPNGYPEEMVALFVMAGDRSTRSAAFADSPMSTLVISPVASVVMSGGAVISGAVVS